MVQISGWGGRWIKARKARYWWQWCHLYAITFPGLDPPYQVHLDLHYQCSWHRWKETDWGNMVYT